MELGCRNGRGHEDYLNAWGYRGVYRVYGGMIAVGMKTTWKLP